jgi:hypothetical protein
MHSATFSEQPQPARPLPRFYLQLFGHLVAVLRRTRVPTRTRPQVSSSIAVTEPMNLRPVHNIGDYLENRRRSGGYSLVNLDPHDLCGT